ncbi:MAG: polymerase sigma factor SigW [Planctomycetota bacterium]
MPRPVAISIPKPNAAEEAVGWVAEAIAGFGESGVTRAADGLGALGARAFSAILPAKRRVRASNPSALSPHSSSSNAKALEGCSDEQLLVAHRAGDAQALRILVDRYRAELHGFLTRLVGSRAGADDVFQEAFLQVHLSADSFDEERRFKPWLYTIAANKGRDFLRRQKRRAAVSLDAPTGKDSDGALIDLIEGDSTAPSLPLESGDEAALVKQVVDGMPPHFREILLLSYFQKLSYAQISDSLSIPLGTVKSRLHAAVACFAESWKLHCARRGVPFSGDARDGAPSNAGPETGHAESRKGETGKARNTNRDGDDA